MLAPAHAARIVPGGNGGFKPTLVAGGPIVGTRGRARRAGGAALVLDPLAVKLVKGEFTPTQRIVADGKDGALVFRTETPGATQPEAHA